MNFKEWLSEEDVQEGFLDSARGLAGGVARGAVNTVGAAWKGYSHLADRAQNNQRGRHSPRDAFFNDLKGKYGDWKQNQDQDAADQKRGLMSKDQINKLYKTDPANAIAQGLVKQYSRGDESLNVAGILNTLKNDKDLGKISQNIRLSASNPELAKQFKNQVFQKVQSALGLSPAPKPNPMAGLTGP